MQKQFKVAGIGELLWDMLPQGKQLGGAPCNFAYHASQAGCESFVVSAIGTDASGDEILAKLDALELDKGYIQRTHDYPTGTVTVTVDANGIPTYIIHENVAWDNIEWNPPLEILAKSMDAVCFGSLAQRSTVSKHTILKFLKATRTDCLRIFDINLRQAFYATDTIIQSLVLANILKLNEDELPVVADLLGLQGDEDQLLAQLINQFDLGLVALTKGGNGSILQTAETRSFMEVPKVKIADTVGAGDSFTAIMVAGLLKKVELKKIHETATRVAAFVCTQQGATPKLSPLELATLAE